MMIAEVMIADVVAMIEEVTIAAEERGHTQRGSSLAIYQAM
jgi:hypothetical protein